MEPHQTDIPELVAFGSAKLAMHVIMGEVGGRIGEMRVIEAHHIVREGNHSLASKTDAPRCDAAIFGIGQPAFLPMSMRIEDSGIRRLAMAEGAVKITRQVKAGHGLKVNFLDGVTVALNFSKDLCLQRSFLGHRPEAAANKNMLADIVCARSPFATGTNHGEITRGVEIFDRRGGFGGR